MTFEDVAALYERGEYEATVSTCDQLLTLHRAPDTLHLRAKALFAMGRVEDAVAGIDDAIRQDPTRAVFHLNRGRILLGLERQDEAVNSFKRASELDPRELRALRDLGWASRHRGDLAGSVAAFEALVAQNHDDLDAHLQLFAALHRAGDFRRGWEEYEWRLRGMGSPEVFDLPFWDGDPLDGRTLLVRAEQGLGDQIHFVRYAPLVKARGGRVVIRCHPSLVRLVRTCPGVDEVLASSADAIPRCDLQVWAGSLPRIMGTTLDTIPDRVPYLWPDPEQVERWRKLLAKFPEFKVGINWEGNRANTAGLNRAVPISMFFPLARMESLKLFSLQKGDGEREMEKVPEGLRIYNLGQFFADLADTAAVMEALDLVITNDTSLAHLAGALGRPVWIILPHDCCWRWLENREDSPWYPTARLFRTGAAEDWDAISGQLTRAAEEMMQLVGDGTARWSA